MFDYVLQFKREAEIINNRFVKYNLFLMAHKESGFDSFVVLNNLSQWRTFVSLIENGSGIVSSKIFNGYVDSVKKFHQYVCFRYGLIHIKDSSNKIRKSNNLNKN